MSGQILVTHAGDAESTLGIASAVADVLREAGFAVRLEPIGSVADLRGCRAVVLGCTIHDGTWLAGAGDFILAHEHSLADIPTWIFAAGPFEAVPGRPPDPPAALINAIDRIGPRDVALFAGSLQPHHLAAGLRVLSKVVRTSVDDHRDWTAIRRWADGIRDTLLSEIARPHDPERTEALLSR